MKVHMNLDERVKEGVEWAMSCEFVIKPQRLYPLHPRVRDRVPEMEGGRQMNKVE